ncbi:MAG: right-handed parallel beta-helix repeat-containing protein, partial [Planctomycetota bacterium]|nr:right-handed parallel beta-helix repeat-containing protein [Planctomycetota bacterium]
MIEGNTIRFAATIGLDCGSETWDGKALTDTAADEQRVMIGGHHLIRDNDVTDNGLCGIAGWNHSGTRIVGNRVE